MQYVNIHEFARDEEFYDSIDNLFGWSRNIRSDCWDQYFDIKKGSILKKWNSAIKLARTNVQSLLDFYTMFAQLDPDDVKNAIQNIVDFERRKLEEKAIERNDIQKVLESANHLWNQGTHFSYSWSYSVSHEIDDIIEPVLQKKDPDLEKYGSDNMISHSLRACMCKLSALILLETVGSLPIFSETKEKARAQVEALARFSYDVKPSAYHCQNVEFKLRLDGETEITAREWGGEESRDPGELECKFSYKDLAKGYYSFREKGIPLLGSYVCRFQGMRSLIISVEEVDPDDVEKAAKKLRVEPDLRDVKVYKVTEGYSFKQKKLGGPWSAYNLTVHKIPEDSHFVVEGNKPPQSEEGYTILTSLGRALGSRNKKTQNNIISMMNFDD